MRDVEAFRDETRRWLQANAPKSLVGTPGGPFSGTWGGRRPHFDTPDHGRWLGMMAERGWTAPTWPAAYGGGGLSGAEAKALEQELKRAKLPPALVGFGLVMIGPTLLEFGTDEQKQRHIPGIVKGEIRWCQGYSEPGAGSDLASLQTSAVPDGDDYIINGQKIWTSYADQSDWIFCLVRTSTEGRKQEGISFILADMETPGINTRPIRLISGSSPFCEVFFEDARAKAADLVGGLNRGWTVAKALLQHERAVVGAVFASAIAGGEAELVRIAREATGDADTGPLSDALHRDRIAQNAMDERAFMLTVKRVQDRMSSGERPGPISSLLKVAGTELNQRRRELAVELLGPAGLGWAGTGFDAVGLEATRQWLRSRGNTIEGGTSEVQLNIVCKHLLGLPS